MLQKMLLMMQERWFDILIGFTIPIFLGIVKLGIEKIFALFDKRKAGFALEGIWCAIHKNVHGQYLVEFMKIKHIKKNYFQINIKQIRDDNSICRYSGNGIKSNGYVYILYESIDRNVERAGTFMLQLRNPWGRVNYLTGQYFEHEEDEQENSTMNYPIYSYKTFLMSSSNIRLRFMSFLTVRRVKKFEEAKEIAERYRR